MIPSSLYVRNYELPHNVDIDPKVEEALCTAFVSPLEHCTEKHYHIIIESTAGYIFEYASSQADIRPDEEFHQITREDTLSMTFSEVRLEYITDWRRMPEIIKHIYLVKAIVFDNDGSKNIALTNLLYHSFAADFFKAISLFPEKFIKGSAFLGDDCVG